MSGNVERNPLVRVGLRLADFAERWFPDAFVFSLAGVVLVFGAALACGESPARLVEVFGQSFWDLNNFIVQMVLVIVGGFTVATSPPVHRLIERLAEVPKTPRGAVAFVAVVAMGSSLLSWGLSLVVTGLLVREICRRVDRVDYRAIGAAAYLGLGSVWALGLSSSAALLQATPSALPPKVLEITGVIPLTQTIFLWQSMAMALLLMGVSVAVAWGSCPSPEDAKTQEDYGIQYKPFLAPSEPAERPADHFDRSPILSWLVAAIALAWIVLQVREKGGFAALDLNVFNLTFLFAGLVLHGSPRSFLQAVSGAIPATAGILVQYPFYAAIAGLITKTALAPRLEQLFSSLSDPGTFPLLVAVYSAVLGFFVPSGGGKWVLEAPYVMAVANQYQVHLGWTVQIYNAAEALPNLLNPFWMLPLMGILSVRARELAGYSVLQLLFHTPLVLFLCWWFTPTLPYVPPQMP